MDDIKQHIINAAKRKDALEAQKHIATALDNVVTLKIEKQKEEVRKEMSEAFKRRIKRIRGGKLQRKVVTDKQGFKIKDGKAVRMSQQERRKRKKAAKKTVRKRRGKTAAIMRARKRSLRKRKSRNL